MKRLKDNLRFWKSKPQEITPDDIHEKFRMLRKDMDQLEHREKCVTLVQIRIQLTDNIKLELEKWEFSEMQAKLLQERIKYSENKN